MAEKRILVFGCSTAWGAWDDEKHGWVTRLQLSLEKGNTDEDYTEVICLSAGGETTRGLLDRLDVECKSFLQGHGVSYYTLKDNIIIFDVGGNDAALIKGKPFVKLEDTKQNISKLVSIAKKYTQRIAFVSLTSVDETKANPYLPEHDYGYTNENSLKYFNAIKEFCEKNNVLFIDILNHINKELLEDGLHPNAKGHQLIAELVEKALKEKGWI